MAVIVGAADEAAGGIVGKAVLLASFVGYGGKALLAVVSVAHTGAVGVDAPGRFVEPGVFEAGLVAGGVGVQQQVAFRVPGEVLAQPAGAYDGDGGRTSFIHFLISVPFGMKGCATSIAVWAVSHLQCSPIEHHFNEKRGKTLGVGTVSFIGVVPIERCASFVSASYNANAIMLMRANKRERRRETPNTNVAGMVRWTRRWRSAGVFIEVVALGVRPSEPMTQADVDEQDHRS